MLSSLAVLFEMCKCSTKLRYLHLIHRHLFEVCCKGERNFLKLNYQQQLIFIWNSIRIFWTSPKIHLLVRHKTCSDVFRRVQTCPDMSWLGLNPAVLLRIAENQVAKLFFCQFHDIPTRQSVVFPIKHILIALIEKLISNLIIATLHMTIISHKFSHFLNALVQMKGNFCW